MKLEAANHGTHPVLRKNLDLDVVL